MLGTRKRLLWVLVLLALIGCQRAQAASTEVTASPTRAEVTPTPTPLPLLKTSSGEPTPYAVAPEVPRITPEELKALLSSPRNVLVIDTRGRDAYEAAHIRGALNIPYDQVESVAPQLSRSAKIVFYCA